jgi:hypothetical protein
MTEQQQTIESREPESERIDLDKETLRNLEPGVQEASPIKGGCAGTGTSIPRER